MEEKSEAQVTLEFVLTIAELVLKYGIPAVLRIVKLWNVADPTIEDIRALKGLIKPPEAYFDPK